MSKRLCPDCGSQMDRIGKVFYSCPEPACGAYWKKAGKKLKGVMDPRRVARLVQPDKECIIPEQASEPTEETYPMTTKELEYTTNSMFNEGYREAIKWAYSKLLEAIPSLIKKDGNNR